MSRLFPRYEINRDGTIWSDRSQKWLKFQTNHRGYLQTRLYKDGKSQMYVIHRLVALQYLPNPNKLPIVNHKDGDKRNNHVSNLEWCTAQQNTDHALLKGNFKSKLTPDHIRQIRELAKTNPQKLIAEQFGLTRMMVYRIVNYKSWKHVP